MNKTTLRWLSGLLLPGAIGLALVGGMMEQWAEQGDGA